MDPSRQAGSLKAVNIPDVKGIPMTLLDLQPPQTTHPTAPSAAMAVGRVDTDLLAGAKFAYATRFVAAHPDRDSFTIATDPDLVPQAGDVVLARVVKLGHHKRLEGVDSRRIVLFEDDLIVVTYGNRYAADQFLATVPDDLGTCGLVAAGGVAARVLQKHDKVADATVIEPVGLLSHRGQVVNVRDCAPFAVTAASAGSAQTAPGAPVSSVLVIAVLGTSMNSGKSTTLAQLAHGLVKAGLRVHTGKATGTGAGNDSHLFGDAGAHRVLDFTDFGYPTTFQVDHGQIRDLFASMIDELSTDNGAGRPDVVLIEIADGVYQSETAELLTHGLFADRVDGLVFAASDALGAVGGVQVLTAMGRTPARVSGVVTSSPIARAETEAMIEVPVTGTFDLADPAVASGLLEEISGAH